MSSRATPFCKVCFDAGKPKDLYTSHFVKDRPGPSGCVVCPTLLNQACRYCKEKGHTPTQCPKLADKQQRTVNYAPRTTTSVDSSGWAYQTPRKTYTTQRRVAPGAPLRERRQEKTEEDTVPCLVESKTNRFAALLAEVEDSDEEATTTSEEVRKAIFGPSTIQETKKPVLVGWAAMAAKPATAQVVQVVDMAQETPSVKKQLVAREPRKCWAGETRRWGDDDSDSSDDESTGSSAW